MNKTTTTHLQLFRINQSQMNDNSKETIMLTKHLIPNSNLDKEAWISEYKYKEEIYLISILKSNLSLKS
jgi:hypothetical protein